MTKKPKTPTKNKIIYFIIIILIFFISSGIMIFIKNIKKDSKENDNIMEEIKTTYQLLENNITTYNEIRTNLATTLDNYYTDNLETDHPNFISLLTKEEDIAITIHQNIEKLAKNCQDRIFTQKEINTICSNYPEYYEQIINVFINDKEQVNAIIKSYNETNNQSLEEYHPKQITDYIDYNNDGKYLERENQ